MKRIQGAMQMSTSFACSNEFLMKPQCPTRSEQKGGGPRKLFSQTIVVVCAMALIAAACQVTAQPTSCQVGEDALFSCSAGKKQIAVCASRGWSAKEGYVQYRFGPPQKAEIVLPSAAITPPASSARAGILMFSGGGGAYLRFHHADTDYIVYSAISGQWGDKGGVAIEKGGKPVGAVRCRGRITSELGPELFDKAGFQRDESDFLLPE